MPRLLRGIARTAVIAGTATAVGGRVQRRQARRFAGQDANAAAERDAAYNQQLAAQQQSYAAQPQSYEPAGGSGDDTIERLKELASLKAQGVLTEAEFAELKAKVLHS